MTQLQHTKENKSTYYIEVCTLMLVKALQNQLCCLTTEKQIRKTYAYGLPSAIQKMGIMSLAEKWLQQEILILSKLHQSHTDQYNVFFHLLFLYFFFRNTKSHTHILTHMAETEKQDCLGSKADQGAGGVRKGSRIGMEAI